jgi:regulator of sigma E protease
MVDSLLTNDPVAIIIAFFVVLIPLILIHEFGHFIAGKAVGITILEFGLGFPPRIRRLFTWRDTEFTLNLIPLGGFVRPLGEDMIRPLDEQAVEKDRQEFVSRNQSKTSLVANATEKAHHIKNPKSVSESGPLARILFMSAGALANFALAVILFVVVAMIGTPQPAIGIEAINPDSSFAQAGLQVGDIVTSVDGVPATSASVFVNQYQRDESSFTLDVQRGDSGDNRQINVSASSSQANANIGRYAKVLGIAPDSPAEHQGLQPGDLIVGFNGDAIDGVDNFKSLTQQHLGQEVNLTINREGKTLNILLTPRSNPPEGQGAIGIVIDEILDDKTAGISFSEQLAVVPQSFVGSVRYGVERVIDVITMTVRIPSQLLSGALTPQEARPVSVVGMSQIGAEVIRQSVQQQRWAPILEFVATISVALGFFNLLPIPALDGGRILFVLIEVLRGKPISPEREGFVHLVGLVLLLSLSVLIILNDIIHPVILR